MVNTAAFGGAWAMRTLRERTRPWHEQVEEDFDLERRLDSRESFLDLLQRFHHLYAWFEPALAQSCDWARVGIDFDARRKLPLLERDLTSLSASGRIPMDLPAMPKLANESQAVGALYVLEGSALGGQIIAARAKSRLGFRSVFFEGRGKATAADWRAFGACVDAWATRHGDIDELVIGAKDAFVAFGDSMRSVAAR